MPFRETVGMKQANTKNRIVICFIEAGKLNPLPMCIESMCFGLAIGTLITCIFFTAGILSKIRNNSRSRKITHILSVVGPIIVVICIAVCLIISI